jgi:exodeoxyribonuclease VII large subunit
MPSLEFEHESKIYTVSELTREIKQLLEGQYRDIIVSGEITNYKQNNSGHCYFRLSDDSAILSAVMFKGAAKKVKFQPENGLEIICFGRLSVYEPQGQYQIIVERMEPVGKGAAQLALEQLIEKLKNEGLLDLPKKDVPKYPKNIGVITSPTGAAIRDILKITEARAPWLNIYIYPALVQGETAGESLTSAFKMALQTHFLDAIIVGRGGGSAEDLAVFNHEALARTIVTSPIPVISAVGHETDFTICDFVADVRAATPSHAAELITTYHKEIINRLDNLTTLLHDRLEGKIQRVQSRLENYSEERLLIRLKGVLEHHKIYLDDLSNRLNYYMETCIKQQQNTLQVHAGKLQSLSPLNILSRGYSITYLWNPDFRNKVPLKSTEKIKKGDCIGIQLSKGELQAKVEKIIVPDDPIP